eukprot:scaffold330314_cov71-Attheya_sp.AAC.1
MASIALDNGRWCHGEGFGSLLITLANCYVGCPKKWALGWRRAFGVHPSGVLWSCHFVTVRRGGSMSPASTAAHMCNLTASAVVTVTTSFTY